MRYGMIGSGSWGTALVKILTEAGHPVDWCVRSDRVQSYIQSTSHNPQYLRSVSLDLRQVSLTTTAADVVERSDVIVVAVPSAYVEAVFTGLDAGSLRRRQVLSAVKGILPYKNILLNELLADHYGFPLQQYHTVMGPCHAEEVAEEKLSYLTFSGLDEVATGALAVAFRRPYLNTVYNTDVYGVQYAAVLKNIYALGAGMAHGLEYGDNFLSVFIANAADEMAVFLRRVGIPNIEMGVHALSAEPPHHKSPNYAASVYLGDLLVTCYSLHSRNRMFGHMIGKGYSVQAARLELGMVAEGYTASRCIHEINLRLFIDLPIAETIYQILWQGLSAEEGMHRVEGILL